MYTHFSIPLTPCVCVVCVTQEEVYRATTKGLIEGLISGYNATVFAYGPTGGSARDRGLPAATRTHAPMHAYTHIHTHTHRICNWAHTHMTFPTNLCVYILILRPSLHVVIPHFCMVSILNTVKVNVY